MLVELLPRRSMHLNVQQYTYESFSLRNDSVQTSILRTVFNCTTSLLRKSMRFRVHQHTQESILCAVTSLRFGGLHERVLVIIEPAGPQCSRRIIFTAERTRGISLTRIHSTTLSSDILSRRLRPSSALTLPRS